MVLAVTSTRKSAKMRTAPTLGRGLTGQSTPRKFASGAPPVTFNNQFVALEEL